MCYGLGMKHPHRFMFEGVVSQWCAMLGEDGDFREWGMVEGDVALKHVLSLAYSCRTRENKC